MKTDALAGENLPCQPVVTATNGKIEGDIYRAGSPATMRIISMPAKQPKPNPAERRIAKREVLAQQPNGTLQLHIENRSIDVDRLRDISPFGVCLQLKAVVDKGAQVQLTYTYNSIQIEVLGTVVWGKAVKSPYPSSLDALGWWVGIYLHPSSTGANFALYQTILQSRNDKLLDESGNTFYW